MSSTGSKIRKSSLQLLIYVVMLFILLLSSNNIQTFLSPNRVLGAQTKISNQTEVDKLFWNNFLTKNPNYIPGWIEIGRTDIAKQIDPNY